MPKSYLLLVSLLFGALGSIPIHCLNFKFLVCSRFVECLYVYKHNNDFSGPYQGPKVLQVPKMLRAAY